MRNLRTQEDIMATWQGDPDKPVVSICCITYNHEPYIEDALEGFLIQETDFPFEILIHDDASTDRTADIIREYKEKYPKLIKPIYQTENQYSKGYLMNFKFNFSRAKGEYIALCEGDDYWVSKNKIISQIEVLERTKKHLCVHQTKQLNIEKESSSIMCDFSQQHIYDSNDVLLSRSQFAATSSYLFKKDALEWFPDIFWKQNSIPYGDFFIEVYAGHDGIVILPRIMSVYRRNVPGSHTLRMKKKNANYLCLEYQALISETENLKCLNGIKISSVEERLKNVSRGYGKKFIAVGSSDGVRATNRYITSIENKEDLFIKFASLNLFTLAVSSVLVRFYWKIASKFSSQVFSKKTSQRSF